MDRWMARNPTEQRLLSFVSSKVDRWMETLPLFIFPVDEIYIFFDKWLFSFVSFTSFIPFQSQTRGRAKGIKYSFNGVTYGWLEFLVFVYLQVLQFGNSIYRDVWSLSSLFWIIDLLWKGFTLSVNEMAFDIYNAAALL